MFERSQRVIFVVILLCPVLSSESAVVTLRDGSAYSSLEVIRYADGPGEFLLEKSGTQIPIRASEIATLQIENRPGVLHLHDGSSYPGLEIIQFDIPKNRLTVKRGSKILNLPLSDIAAVDFLSDQKETVPQASAPAPENPSTPPSGASNIENWQAEGLYSNLPGDFGEQKSLTTTEKAAENGYTPRWKTDAGKQSAAKKKESTAKPRTAATTKAAPKREPRSTREARGNRRSSGGDRGSRDSRSESRSRIRLFDSGSGGNSNETDFGSRSRSGF